MRVLHSWSVSAGLFGVALALRLAHFVTLADSPYADRLWLDLLFFDEWGWAIAGGDWLGSGLFYQDPLYPYFLGTVYSIVGHRPDFAVALQLVLGAMAPVFVYAATRRGMGETEAKVAGILAAAYLPSIFYEGQLLKSWLDLWLVAAALWMMARATGSTVASSWGGAGLLMGLACLARGNLLLVVPALAIWALVDRSSTGARLASRRWPAVAAFLLGAGLVLSATAVRNRIAGGEWVLTTAQAGQNFFLGNNAWNTEGECDPPPFLRTNPKYEEKDFAAEATRRTGRSMTPRELSRFWFAEGAAWIREQPGAWLRLLGKKLRNFWDAYEIPDNIDLYVYREWAPVLRLPLPGFGTLAPLALLGAVLIVRRPGWPRALLVFLVVYQSAVALFFVLSRYRLALLPILFPLAGAGAAELVRRVRLALADRSRASGALGAIALLAGFVVIVHLPVRAPADDPRMRIASAIGLPVRIASVATEHFNLGVIRAKEGDLAGAEASLRRALEEEPGQSKIHVELGKVLARAGRTSEATSHFERAAQIEPSRPEIFHTLGILYRRAGDLASAERAFSEALRIDPRRQSSRKELDALRGAPP